MTAKKCTAEMVRQIREEDAKREEYYKLYQHYKRANIAKRHGLTYTMVSHIANGGTCKKCTDETVRKVLGEEKLRYHYKGMLDLYKRKNIAQRHGVSHTTVLGISQGIIYANV